MSHQKLMAILAGLNAFDAASTVVYVHNGQATEANPLMALLLAWHPMAFVLGKFGLLFVGMIILGAFSHSRLVRPTLFVACAAYVGIAAIHLNHILS
jgi:hypothetical protein